MSKFKKVLCLTLLIGVCMFPASAFASSSHSFSDDKKTFFSSILSVFSGSKSNSNQNSNNNYQNNNNNKNNNQSNKHKVDKDWNSKGWFDWWDDDDWWDDICWWDKNKDDSYKIWERYYCY
ncbi:hypothetical protein [Bacillus sp. FJAT-26390]|uniref:hypothetical protein n=1 Tax=Bacillus sp. FJAT-26390 TaxID=1743142 RepID=UPI000807C4CC|nr:hypothetical protein [Bacillus sp. FJAT-26390]OBZ17486.1 hypothetical protein A7975_06375 [Bacillus sp. FJAT-26390]